MSAFEYEPMVQHGPDTTTYRRLTTEHVRLDGDILRVEPEGLALLAFHAFDDITHLLRTSHLESLRKILDDPEASDNDRFVALELLKNANIAAGHVLPGCQDTGTAIVSGWKGERVQTGADDAAALSEGVFRTYQERNLRFSQMAPLDMYREQNTGNNLPAQIEIYSKPGAEYHFLFVAKGGGSANKTFLYQQSKALLNPDSLRRFIADKIQTIGTSACPPYHLALVIGGTSAEFNLKMVKLASCHQLDDLPTSGDSNGRAFRDVGMEAEVFQLCRETGIGAQFGGKYFAHDVRVIRLPRHGASCPVGLGVSCSADRQARAKITPEGIFLEQLETDPARFLPEVDEALMEGTVVPIDLSKPMDEIRAELTKHPVGTRLAVSGPLVVARDIAHARLKEALDRGEPLPDVLKQRAVYYAGPAKTPDGLPSGSFGPTTAGRMDPYVDAFQARGASMVMLAKGNRSQQVTASCERHGGFYLGSIGGPAARLADHSIKNVKVLMYEDLGMEAIWSIDVEDFPAFTVVDDKGNDFYAQINARRAGQLDV